MLFRPATEADLDRILSCSLDPHISGADPAKLRRQLASGDYRWPHIWIAEHDGHLVARAVWWAPPSASHPSTLDCVWVTDTVADRAELARDLLSAAHDAFIADGAGELPDHHIFLPADWHDRPEVAEAVRWRQAVLEPLGYDDILERWRFEWTAHDDLPAAPSRLRFAPGDDAQFQAAFEAVSIGSLDVDTGKGIARHGVAMEAREHMNVYLSMPGERQWWRLAYLDGELAGLAIPAANNGGPVVGYLGVVPRFRGMGLSDELLAEITRALAAEGATQIRADADATNAPMVAAFDRAGYQRTGVRLVIDRG